MSGNVVYYKALGDPVPPIVELDASDRVSLVTSQLI